MKAKRILILAIALITSLTIYAQPGGGMGGGMRGGMRGGGVRGGGMGRQMGGGPVGNSAPIDFVAATGLFVIDAEPVIKKCKIKDTKQKEAVTNLIASYQKEYYNITFEHSNQIDTLNSFKPNMLSSEVGATPMQGGRPDMKSLGSILQTLREKTIPMHNTLKESMKATLSEKEYKKWETYYISICEDNSFSEKMPQRGGRDSNSAQGGQRGGGMRQRGMM